MSSPLLKFKSLFQKFSAVLTPVYFDKKKMVGTLYYDDRSPPVRSVIMIIQALKLDMQLKFVNLFKKEQLQEEYLKVNAAHTVPTLVDGDLTLTDSHAILIYLCQTYAPESSLYPKDELSRIKIINKLFVETSVLFRRNSDMMQEIIRKGATDVSHHEERLHEAYTILDRILSQSEYMAGDNMTIADISFVTTLSTANMIFPVTGDKWPKLMVWFKKMQALPYYESANEEGRSKLKEFIEGFTKFEFPKHD